MEIKEGNDEKNSFFMFIMASFYVMAADNIK